MLHRRSFDAFAGALAVVLRRHSRHHHSSLDVVAAPSQISRRRRTQFADFFTAARELRAISQAGLYPAHCRILDAADAFIAHLARTNTSRIMCGSWLDKVKSNTVCVIAFGDDATCIEVVCHKTLIDGVSETIFAASVQARLLATLLPSGSNMSWYDKKCRVLEPNGRHRGCHGG
jgi:hypothetical protein